jgi:hypothetical protein
MRRNGFCHPQPSFSVARRYCSKFMFCLRSTAVQVNDRREGKCNETNLKCTPVGRLLFSSPLTGISEKCIEDGVYTCYITRRASGSCTGDVRVMNETLLWSVATSSEWGRFGGLDGVDRGSSRSVVGGSRFSDAEVGRTVDVKRTTIFVCSTCYTNR